MTKEMTENEAINALTDEILGAVEGEEPQGEAVADEVAAADEPQGEPKSEPKSEPVEQKSDETAAKISAIEAAVADIAQQIKAMQAPAQTQAPEYASELGALGLDNTAAQMKQVAEQMAAIKTQMEAQKEEARRMGVFNENLQKLKNEYPTIDPDKMAQWATARGMEHLLGGANGENYKNWEILALAMMKESAPKETPDPVVAGGNNGGEMGIEARLKKGESVSDADFGALIMDAAGINALKNL